MLTAFEDTILSTLNITASPLYSLFNHGFYTYNIYEIMDQNFEI